MKSLPLRFTISACHRSGSCQLPCSAKSFGLLYLSSRLGCFKSLERACSPSCFSDILNPLACRESPPVLTLVTYFLSLHIILFISGYPFCFAIAFIYLVLEASNGFCIEIHTGHPKPNYLNIIIDGCLSQSLA